MISSYNQNDNLTLSEAKNTHLNPLDILLSFSDISDVHVLRVIFSIALFN